MKRIISLILVVAMTALMLVGCGYSIADENPRDFASWSTSDIEAFVELLKNGLQIVDGDFTDDEEVRAGKVLDSIYSTLATNAKKGEQLKEGVIGAHDVLYYCYYVTAEINGVTEYFYTANMKSASPSNLQLGVSDAEGVNLGIGNLFKEGFDLTDKGYEAVTSGKAAAGDVAFVTYTYTYTAEDGAVESATVTNAIIIVSDETVEVEVEGAEGEEPKTETAPKNFASYLNGKDINTTLTKTEFEEEGKGKVSYSGIKINWVGKGNEAGSFTDVTYEEEKKVNNVNGTSIDLKDVELTYHVYPVYYYSVPEINATTIINDVLGKNIKEDTMISVIFGTEYAGIHVDHEGHDHADDDFTDEEKEKMEKLEALLALYVFVEKEEGKDDVEYDLGELCEKIADLQADYADTKTEYDSHKKDLDAAQTKVDDAQAKVDAAGESVTAEQTKALEDAKANYDKVKKSFDTVEEKFNKAKDARDAKVTLLLSKEITEKDEEGNDVTVTVDKKIDDGYRKYTYDNLRDKYNDDIKNKLASEVYYFIDKYVKVNSYPEEAVDLAYDQLMQNYQSDFYTGKADSTTTNYSKYEGDFDAFLIAAVTTDSKVTVKTYDEALAQMRVMAEGYVAPVLKIYLAAIVIDELIAAGTLAAPEFDEDEDKFDSILVTEEEFEAYAEELGEAYVEYYGENGIRYAQQFDRLMNYLLDSDEEDGVVTYKLIEKFTKDEEKSGSALDKEAAEEK